MLNINAYLSKYDNLGLKEKEIKDYFLESIKDICGIVVDNEKVQISDNYINLDIQGVEKSEIFINQEKIQELFGVKLGERGYNLDGKRII